MKKVFSLIKNYLLSIEKDTFNKKIQSCWEPCIFKKLYVNYLFLFLWKLLFLFLLVSGVASAQFSPTGVKTRFANGIGLGTKQDAAFGVADSLPSLSTLFMFKHLVPKVCPHFQNCEEHGFRIVPQDLMLGFSINDIEFLSAHQPLRPIIMPLRDNLLFLLGYYFAVRNLCFWRAGVTTRAHKALPNLTGNRTRLLWCCCFC